MRVYTSWGDLNPVLVMGSSVWLDPRHAGRKSSWENNGRGAPAGKPGPQSQPMFSFSVSTSSPGGTTTGVLWLSPQRAVGADRTRTRVHLHRAFAHPAVAPRLVVLAIEVAGLLERRGHPRRPAPLPLPSTARTSPPHLRSVDGHLLDLSGLSDVLTERRQGSPACQSLGQLTSYW